MKGKLLEGMILSKRAWQEKCGHLSGGLMMKTVLSKATFCVDACSWIQGNTLRALPRYCEPSHDPVLESKLRVEGWSHGDF